MDDFSSDVRMLSDDGRGRNNSHSGRARGGSPHSNPSSSRQSSKSRPTVVCAECKRLKLKCDKEKPCGRCKTKGQPDKCIYESVTNEKPDVDQLNNTLISHRNVLDAISRLLGVPDDERDVILNASGYPPKPGFKLSFDVTRLRHLLNYTERDDGSRPTTSHGLPPARREGEPEGETPVRMIAFSQPPTSLERPSPRGRQPSGSKRSASAMDEPPTPSSTSVQQTVLDRASKAFQSHSIAIPPNAESNLSFWTNAMGWEPHLVYTGGILPESESSPAYTKFLKDPNVARSMIPIVAPYSEGDFQERERPKDLLILDLSYRLFVGPTIQAGLNVSRSGPGLPPPLHAVSPGTGERFNVVSPTVVSPGRVPLLVTPAHVRQYLPSPQWRTTFWKEYDRVMIVHDGIGGLGPNGFLRRRIESMIEWAETYDDGRSEHSVDTLVGDSVPPSPVRTRHALRGAPPTLSLFALAAAVFALGSLNYTCKAAHGLEPELNTASSGSGGSGTERLDAKPLRKKAQTLQPFVPGKHPIPEGFSPHNLHSLARACLMAHDSLDLPSSLDYLHAHMLCWLYLLHPSDSLSNVTNSGFNGAVKGVAGGSVTTIESAIWKELGKCVNVARVMGLDVVDRDDEEVGDAPARPLRGNPDLQMDEMCFWEKEIRRRVWWQLVCFETRISGWMGCLSLVPDANRYCHAPMAIDDAKFDPLCNSYPAATNVVSPQSTMHFALKCSLAILHQAFTKETFRDSTTDELSYERAQAFANRINAWKEAVPQDYRIAFGEKTGDSQFPSGDLQGLQAVDLHIEANLLMMKLWHPFLQAAFDGHPSPSRQAIELATVTAANQIIIASQHLLSRFGNLLPVSFGFYGFGRAVYLAGTLLGTVFIHAPDLIFRTVVREGLDHSIGIITHHLVAGKPDPSSSARTKYEVHQILSHLQMAVQRVTSSKQAPTGGRQRPDEHTDRYELRYGFQVPFVGAHAVLSEGEIDILYAGSQRYTDPTGPLPPAGLEERYHYRGGERVIHHLPKKGRKNGSLDGGLTTASEESDAQSKKLKPKASRASLPSVKPSPAKTLGMDSTPKRTPTRPATKINARIGRVTNGDMSQESANETTDQPSQPKRPKNGQRPPMNLPGPSGRSSAASPPMRRSLVGSPAFDGTMGESSRQPVIHANPAPNPQYAATVDPNTSRIVTQFNLYDQPQRSRDLAQETSYFSGSETGGLRGLSIMDEGYTSSSEIMPSNPATSLPVYDNYSQHQQQPQQPHQQMAYPDPGSQFHYNFVPVPQSNQSPYPPAAPNQGSYHPVQGNPPPYQQQPSAYATPVQSPYLQQHSTASFTPQHHPYQTQTPVQVPQPQTADEEAYSSQHEWGPSHPSSVYGPNVG